ncbi:SIS domain-containing protein [Candidatus Dependentiae bacterium]|nr:SIS domain-containing protein [Candidatus Dependentiae bacterium]
MKIKIAENIKILSSYLKENENYIISSVETIASRIAEIINNGGKIITMGNGGSASDAQHFTAELMGRFLKERKPYESICINTNVSNITSIANDYGYEYVFERQIYGLCRKNDSVICYSTSGNSANILKAASAAKSIGALLITFTGFSGGKLKNMSDINFNVSINSTARVQEVHCLVNHLICEIIENRLN